MQAIQCQVWGKKKLTHDDLQDLEEIEEWNEYGELRMQVNNVQALDSFPDPTTTASSAAGTPTAEGGAQSTTQPAAPKQSTIKIQSPPSKQESKDSSVSLAMRQASEEAAAKAKENKSNAINKPAATSAAATAAAPTSSGAGLTEKKQPEKQQPEKQQPEKQQSESKSATTTSTTATTAPTTTTDKQGDDSVRRKSIIGEIAGEVRRPRLVPEDAAVSSANLHADYPTALREHHRTSIVSATSKEERDQVAQDLRKSISGGNEEMLSSLRKGHGHSNSNGDDQEVRTIETIPQDPFEDEE